MLLNQMMQNNPNMKQLNDYINKVGDPQKAFYQMAKEQGVDPQQILEFAKEMGFKP